MYFALKGENFNGNKFAEEALNTGALFAIVDEVEYQTSNKTILVKDVLQTLQSLATHHRNELDIPIIALTGSNGKTTTKELIREVLNQKYNVSATKGNLNNHIGVPLTLLSMTPETEIGIVEMGANHLKEIEFLCDITQPNFGYITNFGKAHLEGFGSLEGIIKGKSEMYQYLSKTNGIAFTNPKDSIQTRLTKDLNRIPFADSIQFKDVNPFVDISFENQIISSQLIGSYNFTNIAAAICIGQYFRVSHRSIKRAIENYTPSNNRSQIIRKGTNKIILDAYNANPTSVEAALDNFNLLKTDNKVIILGDMFELGESSQIEHQYIATITDNMSDSSTFLIGKHFYGIETKKASKFEGFSDFIKNVNINDIRNSTILIKGSRGMALERLLDFL